MNKGIIETTNFSFPGQTGLYHGKVRDVYSINDELLVMVATDRISAFDVILPRCIPYKGQVLNQVAAFMLNQTKDIVPNWVVGHPDPNVTIGKKCKPFKVEMVIRGYLAGHAWRQYQAGFRMLCGVTLPDNMKENERFADPIITPTTKADAGHDADISKAEIIRNNLVSAEHYELMEQYASQLFQKGTEIADQRGLILVDTKYEFGLYNNKVHLMDEIHTPDSSRYFYKEYYQDNFKHSRPQKQLSKEFVRQWLIENNFQGREGEVVPAMNDAWVETISKRYIELYELITAEHFHPPQDPNPLHRIEKNIRSFLKTLE